MHKTVMQFWCSFADWVEFLKVGHGLNQIALSPIEFLKLGNISDTFQHNIRSNRVVEIR